MTDNASSPSRSEILKYSLQPTLKCSRKKVKNIYELYQFGTDLAIWSSITNKKTSI